MKEFKEFKELQEFKEAHRRVGVGRFGSLKRDLSDVVRRLPEGTMGRSRKRG